MITRTELQYVGEYAQNVPYPGDTYASEVMEKLANAVQLYKERYQDKTFNLILSNGEEINFTILPKNLCHILGIDYKTISGEQMRDIQEKILGIANDGSISSYKILSKIIEKCDDILENDRHYSNPKILNYYRILIKCSIFMQFSDFASFNFGCINFDKNNYNQAVNKTFKPNSTKLIITPSDDALIPYYIIGLMPDNGTTMFVPETLFATPDYLEYFIKQELLVPIQLLINDKQNLSKLIATPEEKLNILKMYKFIIQNNNIDSFINIYNDYETNLREMSLKRVK